MLELSHSLVNYLSPVTRTRPKPCSGAESRQGTKRRPPHVKPLSTPKAHGDAYLGHHLLRGPLATAAHGCLRPLGGTTALAGSFPGALRVVLCGGVCGGGITHKSISKVHGATKCERVNGTRTKKDVSACAYFGCCLIKIMNECDFSYWFCAAAGAISAF